MKLEDQNIWDKGLDLFKQKLGLETDTALADHFEMSRQMISAIRKGKKPPPNMVLQILDITGMPITKELLLSLLPPELAEELRKRDKARK